MAAFDLTLRDVHHVPKQAAERRPQNMKDLQARRGETGLPRLGCGRARRRDRPSQTAECNAVERRIDRARIAHALMPKLDAEKLSRIEDLRRLIKASRGCSLWVRISVLTIDLDRVAALTG